MKSRPPRMSVADEARAYLRRLPDPPPLGEAPRPEPPNGGELPAPVCLLDAEDEAPPAWLVPDLIPAGEPVLFVGPDGSMKSTLALHLACAVAAGAEVFGHGPAAARPVLVVSGEDPRGVIKNRCEAIAKGHGWARERVLGNLHVLALGGTDLAAPRWRAHLVAAVAERQAGLVILDPLADLAGGDENDNTERRAVVATWRALAQPTGAAVVMVHHASKPGAGGERTKRDRIRGASAIAAASRCTYFLEASDAGVHVECLKMSRAEKHPAFVVAADVSADPANRAVWTSARFTRTTQRRAAMTHAARVLLALIAERPGLTGNKLRKAAEIGRDALFDGLNELQRDGRIRSEPGPRGAQFWHLTELAASDPDWSGTGPDHSPPTGPDWSPLKGGGPVTGPVDVGGSAGIAQDDDAAYLADERAALERPEGDAA